MGLLASAGGPGHSGMDTVLPMLTFRLEKNTEALRMRTRPWLSTPTTPAEALNVPAPKPRGPATRPAPKASDLPATPRKAPVEPPAEDDPFSAPPSGRATDDPFGDEPLRDDRLDQRDERMEESAAETDDGFDQRDRTSEEAAAELDDSFDQRDAQQEREAAGGF